MNTFRLLIKNPSEALHRAIVVDAAHIDAAKRLTLRRIEPSEEISAINARHNNNWITLEGPSISDDQITRHSSTEVGTPYEGTSIPADTEVIQQFRRPLSAKAAEDRINIRNGISRALPSDRLATLDLIEKKFDGAMGLAKLFIWLLIISIAGSFYLTKFSEGLGMGALLVSLFVFGVPAFMSVSQKDRHEERKMIISDIRRELKANNGLLDNR